MKRWMPVAMTALLLVQAAHATDDDDKPAAPDAGLPQLNAEQRQAVGIIVRHPVAAKSPERTAAMGLVLDGTGLLEDGGEADVTEAAQKAAGAEIARLRALYRGGAGASLKALEAAETEHTRLQVQAQVAAARFTLHWGPVAAMPLAARQKIFDAVKVGRSVLVRADLPGRHSLGTMPRAALMDVDGILVPGKVLGVLRQSADVQSAAMLIEVEGPPVGLGPGARVPLTLVAGVLSGFLLPRDAVLYDESGAYVYKQIAAGAAQTGKDRYAPVKVKLLTPLAEGWLTNGVDGDDNIVVHGAGVLWSLQGVGSQAADDDDD